MKRILLLITILCVCSRLNCRAAYTQNQSLRTIIPSATEITPIGASTSGTISPETGENSGLSAIFSLKTNGDDNIYDYVLSAKLVTQENSEVNAYGFYNNTPMILLGHNSSGVYPTEESVKNLKYSPAKGNNPNVIAYPINSNVVDLGDIIFENTSQYGGSHFKVKVGNSQEGYVNQFIGLTPVPNTYYYGEDTPGVYKAFITLSAFRKP